MMEFDGFPSRTQYTLIPNLFFSSLLSQIDDLAELKVVLHIFWVLHRKKDYPRLVTYDELAGDPTLMSGLGRGAEERLQALGRGLRSAVQGGLLLDLALERDGSQENIYLLNTEANRRALNRIRQGEISIGLPPRSEPYVEGELPDLFRLYEDNIGVLTPLIAEHLKEAESTYPPAWMASAIQEAVSHNHRSWSYIEAILRRWQAEGKDSGETRGHTEKERSPKKYFRGAYGHLVKRRIP